MPKKGGKKKGKGKKKSKKTVADAGGIIQRFLKCYERNCAVTDSQMCAGIKNSLRGCIENEAVLTKFILESVPVEKEGDLPVLIEPLLAVFRQERYTFIKDLHIWNYPMSFENTATLSLLIEKACYPMRLIELLDCLLEPYSIHRFARSFNKCETLTHIVLDYNEFGDEGCKNLCKGLEGNTSMLSISMCYCGLEIESGYQLGKMIGKTAVRELYLDGNDLECEGAMELIKVCTEQAEYEACQRAEEALRKEQEKLEKLERVFKGMPVEGSKKEGHYRSGAETSGDESKEGKKKKKKKGKKKKKKGPPPPPPVGPWLYKLHIVDNGIDSMTFQKEFAPLMFVRVLKRLIMYSDCLEELDLDDNLIGDLAGKEILEGLEYRKEKEKLGGVKLRTTHRLNADTFSGIQKLGSGLKKKKKGGKKKKKK